MCLDCLNDVSVANEVPAKRDDISNAGKAYGCQIDMVKHLCHEQLQKLD